MVNRKSVLVSAILVIVLGGAGCGLLGSEKDKGIEGTWSGMYKDYNLEGPITLVLESGVIVGNGSLDISVGAIYLREEWQTVNAAYDENGKVSGTVQWTILDRSSNTSASYSGRMTGQFSGSSASGWLILTDGQNEGYLPWWANK